MAKKNKKNSQQTISSNPNDISQNQEQGEDDITKLKNIITSLQKKVTNLEDKVEKLDTKVESLESELKIAKNCSEVLSTEVDRLQQYSRRNCLIVSGIPVKQNETTEDLKEAFQKEVLKDMGVQEEEYDFEYDKIHRVGKADGRKQNLIIRFRSHQFPSDVYHDRKRIKNKNIKIKPSLTKKRTTLLRHATAQTNEDENVDFCFADVNGNIKIRFRNKYKGRYVHTIENIQDFEGLMDTEDDDDDDDNVSEF